MNFLKPRSHSYGLSLLFFLLHITTFSSPFLIFLFLSHFFSLLPSLPPSSTQPPLSPVVHIPDTRRECQITSQQPRSLLLVISLENLRGIFLSFHHLHSSMVSPSCRVCCLFFPTCHWSCTLPNTLRVRS